MAIGTAGKNVTKSRSDPLLLILIVLFVVMLIVGIGTIGYRIFAEIEWIDAFHNGALVFTATSEVTPITTYNGKIFSSIYNLLSGIFVLVLLGVILRGALVQFDQTDNTDNQNDDYDSNDDCSDLIDDYYLYKSDTNDTNCSSSDDISSSGDSISNSFDETINESSECLSDDKLSYLSEILSN